MRKPAFGLLACALALSAFGFGQGAVRASAATEPDPDAAYCPYGSVQGTATYTPPMTSSVLTRAETLTVQAQCVGAGDEGGSYDINLSGTTTGDCGGATGSGTVSGSSPEGAMSGTYTYARSAVHYYIAGTYTAAGESHQLHLWLDIVPVADPNQVCFYSVASLIGHGATIDGLSGDGSDTVDFVAQSVALSPPMQLVGGSGTYAFSTTSCEMVSVPDVGSCHLNSNGVYSNIVCGTGTMSGTAFLTGPDGGESMSYTITMVDGSGQLQGTMAADDGNAIVTGTVDMAVTGSQAPSACVTQFELVGHLTITP